MEELHQNVIPDSNSAQVMSHDNSYLPFYLQLVIGILH